MLKSEDYSLDDLLKHLRIEEEVRAREKQGSVGSKVYHVQAGKKACRGGPQKPKLGVNHERFKKVASSKRTGKCHVCGDTGHYARECKERKSGNNELNVV